jgi:hypothetical protein
MSVYNGHKKYHGFKMQCVYAPDGMIIHYAGPYASRHHDNWVLRDSRLEDMLRADFELNEATAVPGKPGITHFHLYGDPGMLLGRRLVVLAACATMPRFLASLVHAVHVAVVSYVCEWQHTITQTLCKLRSGAP